MSNYGPTTLDQHIYPAEKQTRLNQRTNKRDKMSASGLNATSAANETMKIKTNKLINRNNLQKKENTK